MNKEGQQQVIGKIIGYVLLIIGVFFTFDLLGEKFSRLFGMNFGEQTFAPLYPTANMGIFHTMITDFSRWIMFGLWVGISIAVVGGFTMAIIQLKFSSRR